MMDEKVVLPSKVSNLKRSVIRKLNNKKVNLSDRVSSLYLCDSEGESSGYVGKTCDQSGITVAILDKILSKEYDRTQLPQLSLSNEINKELENFRKNARYSYIDLRDWICALSLSNSSMNEHSVRSNVERMIHKRS